MSDQTDILNLLKPYGLSDEAGRIYLYLLTNGYSPVLHISRALHIGRTKTYRLIDKLKAMQLLESKVDERGMKYGAADPLIFKQIVSQQENLVTQLKVSLPDVLNKLKLVRTTSNPSSKVLYYTGIEGLKQITYNITSAKKILRVFEVEHLANFLPRDFSEMIREKLVERQIKTLDLTNKVSFPDFTNVTEMIKSYSEFRHIPKKQLSIDFEILIYNDVYASYSYKEGNIFCVEMYSQQLADMQKQIFDFIWSNAKIMKFISPNGACTI